MFFYYFLKVVLRIRYRLTIKGLEKLNPKTLNKSGGVLFLPNHPAMFVDPTLVTLTTWFKYPIRPMVAERHYNIPVAYQVLRLMNSLPVPDFETVQTTETKKRGEEAFQSVMDGLRKGENFMIYPAGRLKSSSLEIIGGASGVHRIIHGVPKANIVLVRTKGLWGSSFSRALTGKTPPLFGTVWKGVKVALKNLLFFTPRRNVIIEFEPVPTDFPYEGTRLEMNRYLEKWYNRPDGLTKQVGEYPGDSLMLVSYSMWREELPEVYIQEEVPQEEEIKPEEIPSDIQKSVINKLAQMSDFDPEDIKPEMNLSIDLGLDSLDMGELVAYLKDNFNIPAFPITELTTVNKLLAIASSQIEIKEEEIEVKVATWTKTASKFKAQIAHGETIGEVFLHNCERMGRAYACCDARAGMLRYDQLKLRVLLLAEYIRHLPGNYIGILLPASVAAAATILACEIAGKVPLMLNWTIGPRHLKSVVELSKVKTILSSWAFVERLEKVDLSPIEDKMLMLEDVRDKFTIIDKLRAFIRSKRKTKALLKLYNIHRKTKDDQAVLLFTSGTEAAPKGVPLTHHNILSNQRAAYDALDIYSDDVIFGFLPPFHSFGFTVTTIFGLLAGVKTAFSPDPTDGKNLAREFETWGITILCGAPTFIKNMLKVARPEQLHTMRICVTGAEKAPPELFHMLSEIGKEQSVIEGYGITECSPILTCTRTGKPRKGVGEPLAGVELLIVHPDSHQPVPIGTQGLILARGPNVFSGYLNPGIASPFITVEGKRWYVTGDLGYLDDENRLTISGRLKRFIKIGPEMISLPAVEEALLHMASDKEWPRQEGPILAISGKEETGKRPKIVLFATFDTTIEEINQALKEAGFSNLIKVSTIIKVNQIPIMGTGKINYRAMEEKHLA